MKQKQEDYNPVFAEELIEGLSQEPKKLSSKYFYDERGDRLFQKIMQLSEYYLTKAEYEIFSLQKEQIYTAIQRDQKFQLIEFGAGDGLKTKVLLDHFMKKNADFEYLPIDISASVLKKLQDELHQKHPDLTVKPMAMTYFQALKKLPKEHQKVVLFLGGNIGNFNLKAAENFLKQIQSNLSQGDQLLLGIDLKKHPKIILNAYNDAQGVTKEFNLNLLRRINREFDGNFELSDFDHYPTYDPISGETRSFLISLKQQSVELKSLKKTFHFRYAEPIFMEISKKYELQELEKMADDCGFTVKNHFFDCKKYFVNTLWEVSP